MRTAVLALAFEGLDAEIALTEAWSDNEASLGVSRSLGYLPNGSVRHRRDDGRRRDAPHPDGPLGLARRGAPTGRDLRPGGVPAVVHRPEVSRD